MHNRLKNSRIKNSFIDVLGLNPIQDRIPDTVIPSVQPVFNVGATRCDVCRYADASNSTAVTVYTTPVDKDFYLSSVVLSVVKDATATSVRSAVVVRVDGTDQRVISIPGFSTTAQNQTVSITLSPPIKVDRNTVVSLTNSTNVANVTASACIQGYTEIQGGV